MKYALVLVQGAILILLTACGGGGSTGQASSSTVISSGSSTSASSSSNSSTSTVASSSTSNVANKRLLRQSFDFDNNGIFEGEMTLTYDNGKPMTITFTYQDDGTPDTEFFSLGYGKANHSYTYSYDDNDRITITDVVFESNSDPVFNNRRIITTLTWDDDLVTAAVSEFYGPNGGLESTISVAITYTDQRITGWEFTVENDLSALGLENLSPELIAALNGSLLTISHALSYGSNGLPESITIAYELPSTTETVENYTWSPTGQVLSIVDEYLSRIFTYSSEGKLMTRTQNSDGDQVLTTFNYDDAGLLIELTNDVDINQIIDSVATFTWEEGLCVPVMFWESRVEPNFITTDNGAYLPGTGYARLNFCSD